MLLKKLRCAHFKNYTAVGLAFADQLNFIVGPNGAGKTTLMKTVSGIGYALMSQFKCFGIKYLGSLHTKYGNLIRRIFNADLPTMLSKGMLNE